ncbi:hypothetical protein PGTUg99_022561 [Puccinia graminis f. sp. tritici]|uniref:Uncharacterized protein n=1 Tax=Puccinia graminis f. sp. tritici TaxID=56615 RepID=A0A5B0N0K0_PUCGR|nr:hypothetical protein PGTUg99_022365 [Puccinia graminis f. sp. tritici]KAA1081610.1 hypothetical protein PGTUg99_022561 [Puccinia graminis f. sp. tritici]
MFQPCHRCDRARSAISVPSPRYSSFLSVGTSLLRLVRSVTISLSLEFNRSPLNLDSNLVTRPTATTSRLCPRNSTDGGSISTCKPSAPAFLCSLSPRTPKKPSLLSALPPHATSIERYPQNLSHYACRHAFLLLASSVGILSSSSSFPPHQLSTTASYIHFPSKLFHYPSTIHSPFYCPTMSSIFDNCDTNDFYCEGRSDPSIDIGVRYYPDRDQWSPIFNPRVVPDDNADGNKGPIEAVGNKGPIEAVGNQGPVDIKPIVEAKEKGPAEATVDPASINTILACSASLVYIPKGMEIVETRTHYYPLKDKWHAINDPSRHYDCPHPFVCVPWSVHDPELPPGLPVPFLRNLNLPVPAPTPAPSTSSSESSSNDSDSSSTYPLISNYINLNHQGVQKLLLDDNTPPTAVCIYTEEDVMRIFEGIAPEYVDMCSEYPPSSLAESDRRVMFFENMQWFFRNKRSTYLSTRKF